MWRPADAPCHSDRVIWTPVIDWGPDAKRKSWYRTDESVERGQVSKQVLFVLSDGSRYCKVCTVLSGIVVTLVNKSETRVDQQRR